MPHNQQLIRYSVVVDPVKVVKIQLITTDDAGNKDSGLLLLTL